MQKREGRSFAPLPTPPSRLDIGRTGRKGAPHTGLPVPFPLPSLTSALSRRAALFGAVTVAGISVAAVVPAQAGTAALSANDARLVAIAAELTELDRFLAAYPAIDNDDSEKDHPAYYAALDAVVPLEDEISALPADTMAGVLAKARASKVPTCRGVVNGLADSVCSDLLRLHAVGALA